MSDLTLFPVQTRALYSKTRGTVRKEVALRAYEVYCALFGEQPAIVTGNCRGGFGTTELVGYLYAHSFPREEWRARFDEALEGLDV